MDIRDIYETNILCLRFWFAMIPFREPDKFQFHVIDFYALKANTSSKCEC